MIRAIFILCVISRANSELQTFHRQLYISRKSRSNANPTHSGFIYSKLNKDLGIMTTFDDSYQRQTEKYSENTTTKPIGEKNATLNIKPTECNVNGSTSDQNVLEATGKQYENYSKAKIKCQQEKAKESDDVGKHTKTVMQYQSPSIIKKVFISDTDKQFHIDDEDVRTDSKNVFNGWPYSYNGPYDYQMKNVNFQKEKAQDKRFFGTDSRSFIPVHENVEDDGPYSTEQYIPKADYKYSTTDNPNYGNQPFFSSVLSDYFERNHEEDPLIFKDFSWGEEFDNGLSSQDIDDRRSKRRHDNEISGQKNDAKAAERESFTEKAYDRSQEYDTYLKGDSSKDSQGLDHAYNGYRHTAFKDFVDSFANKFGSDEQNKNSKFMLKQNQDKGEKRKGFRRVYHKDEYQEDNEFYDNTDKSAHSEENGGTNFKNGEAKAILQSHAAALGGNENNSLTRKGSKDDAKFVKSNNSKESRKGQDSEISRYRDIAKNAALSNSVDYIN